MKLSTFKAFFLWVVFTAYCIVPVAGQSPPVKYIGIEQGLSNNAVTSITQDSYGFIWMGTYDGLNRYDGYQFKIFRNVWGNPNSLLDNHIKALKSAGDRIYVGTEKGLMYFDYADLKFHPLYYKKDQQVKKIDFNINQIAANQQGDIYVANGTCGVLKFTEADTVGTQIYYGVHDQQYGVQAIGFDQANQLWAFVNGKGLGKCGINKVHILPVSNSLHSVSCLAITKQNEIWAGTNNGLYRYTANQSQAVRFDDAEHKLSSTNVFNLKVTVNGDIWIATNGGGIDVWSPRTARMTYIQSGETQNSLRSSAVDDVYEDSENRKWIATLRGGVNVIDSKTIPFHLYTHDSFNKNSVVNNFILSFTEDELHNVWIGTDGGGLSYWNRKLNAFKSFTHQGDGTISSNFIVSIVNDYTKTLWVATFNGGIDAFDKKTNRFRHYPCYNPLTKSEDKTPWKIYEDAMHRLWVGGTWGGSLYLFNRKTDRFELFDQNLKNIHSIYEDSHGQLWGGNYSRLIKIDPVQKKHQFYVIGQVVRAISQGPGNQLWIGTDGGGLVLFNAAAGKISKRYTVFDGLPSNSILNILSDNHQNLWCSTYNGLTKYNLASGKFVNFFASDGLQSNQFNYNAAVKLSTGEMLFGGIKGFNRFYPDSIETSAHQPPLRLTDLKINNQAVERTAFGHQQPLNNLQELTIPYNEATILVNYTALEYSFPEKISYAYYLENWDHHWNYVGKLKSAYFSRLDEGKYILRIKATGTGGVWNNKELVVAITVLPPWYRSWLAYFLYAAVFGALIYWFWLYRLRQARLRYEIEIANLKVAQEKAENEKKLSFFTNVSHEFRTPLTLIINPIKDMLSVNRENEELNIVYKNAKRLLGLLDHLLLFRKTESENAAFKVSKIDFKYITSEIYSCFTQQARIKGINYTIKTSSEPVEIFGDREKIEIALFNLISNAIKFTPGGGAIGLSVRSDEGYAYFEITDTGIGINSDIGEKLFDKFYQVKEANSLKTGFGIGLYLVKNFIEQHHGTITYDSTSGLGTKFTLRFLKGAAHLKGYQIHEDSEESPLIGELMDYEQADTNGQEQFNENLQLLISDKLSILIIDDNAEIRAYIRRIFAPHYTVFEAADGSVGLELIKKQLPDVIISDIVMPGLSGLALCRLIKEDMALSHIPIILLTGESTPDIRLKGIEEGAVDFVSKPFDKDLLLARVKGIIKNKQELQKYFFSEVTLKGKTRDVSEVNKDFLYKCIEIIEGSLLESEMEVNELAEKLGMSYSNLYKKIKEITGKSINGFIRFVRLRKAAELMINTNCNVNEAAFWVGFNDVKYFREHFNKQFGVNPSEFIKKHRVAFQQSYSLNKLVK